MAQHPYQTTWPLCFQRIQAWIPLDAPSGMPLGSFLLPSSCLVTGDSRKVELNDGLTPGFRMTVNQHGPHDKESILVQCNSKVAAL